MNKAVDTGIATTLVFLLVAGIIGVGVVIPFISDIVSDAGETTFGETKLGCEDVIVDYFAGDLVTTPTGATRSRIYAWNNVAYYAGDDRPNQMLTENVHYDLNWGTGQVIYAMDYLTVTGGRFTSIHDVAVPVFLGATPDVWANSKLMWFDSMTVDVYNCSNTSQIYEILIDYNIGFDIATIEVDSMGAIPDDTEVCFDATGNVLHETTALNIEDDDFYICYYKDTKHSGMMNLLFSLLPVIMAIVLLLAFVGFVYFK